MTQREAEQSAEGTHPLTVPDACDGDYSLSGFTQRHVDHVMARLCAERDRTR